MNNRKKQRNRKIILIITVTIIVFSSISLIFSRTQWGIERMISDTVAVVEYYVIKKPIEFISNLFNEYNELKDVYDENKILREQLAAYASVEVNTNVLSNEIDDLKKALDLKELTTDYNVKTATVISRDASNWTNEITIDLGSMACVKEDMVVVASKGMIGKVTSVTEVSSTVQLLTAEKPVSDLPVQIMNGDQNAYGLLKGYDVESKCYEVTLLSNIDKLEPNANVITSGLGGDQKAPKGIYIGVAEGMDVSSDGTTKTLKVKPAEDFSDLTYVSVVFRGNNNE
ncbi:MAG: rod shape-determining protein MreC [Thomasclavelia spiroformis]